MSVLVPGDCFGPFVIASILEAAEGRGQLTRHVLWTDPSGSILPTLEGVRAERVVPEVEPPRPPTPPSRRTATLDDDEAIGALEALLPVEMGVAPVPSAPSTGARTRRGSRGRSRRGTPTQTRPAPPRPTPPPSVRQEVSRSPGPERQGFCLPFLTSAKVLNNLGGIPKIDVELQMPIDVGKAFLNSNAVKFGGLSTLEVFYGYSSGPNGQVVRSDVHSGLMLKPDISQDQDGVKVTLHAQGVNPSITSTSSGRTFRGTRQTIINEILRGYDPTNPRGCRLDVSRAVKSSDEMRAALTSETFEYAAGNKTDYQIIYQLLWEIGCWTLWEDNVLYPIPRTLMATEPPKVVFVCTDVPGGVLGTGDPPVLPLRNVSSDNSALYLPAGVTEGFRRAGIQERERTNRGPNVVGERTSPTPRTGGGSRGAAPSPAAPGADAQGAGADYLPGEPADQVSAQQARTEFQAIQSNLGFKLSGESLGVIGLFPGDIVTVLGYGPDAADGNYVILTQEDSLGSGGFTSKLDMVCNVQGFGNNAQGVLGSAQVRRALGPRNPHRGSPNANTSAGVGTPASPPTPQPPSPSTARGGRNPVANRRAR